MRDSSQANPRLHALYVTYAQEELILIARIIEDLNHFSRGNPSLLASQIAEYRAALIKDDTAYREAAWRILANDLLVLDEPIGA